MKFIYLLCMLMLPSGIYCQMVTGIVRDYVTQKPIPGITVCVQETIELVSTDDSGLFKIMTSASSNTLQFKGAGFEILVIKADIHKRMTITLHAKEGKLDEVQVIAYGTST